MAKEKEFIPSKLILGVIYREGPYLERALEEFCSVYGEVEEESDVFPFDVTNYYEKEMGGPLYRRFFVIKELIDPSKLSELKIFTNRLEEKIMEIFSLNSRPVNLDPAIMTPTSLIVATAKNYSHRIPLRDGIYAHLEYIFLRKGVKILEWTYQDFKKQEYMDFFWNIRKKYLLQLNKGG